MARGKQSASSPPRATLIGDIVGSRRVADRSAAHLALNSALRDVAASAIDPPAFTVGDEFQGSYPTVGAAIDAALKLRLAVAPGIDVRFGIGWGAVTMLDASARIQDGPGWWAAREAIDSTDKLGDKDTADLFTGISRANDKTLWFIEAHLQDKA